MSIVSLELYPTDVPLYLVLPTESVPRKGDYLIVRGPEEAEEAGVVQRLFGESEDAIPAEIQEAIRQDYVILRVATDNDRQRIEANERMVENALRECEEFVAQHNLNMRLVTAHFSFDGRQVMFVFTAESRVDFRNLVKDLARHFKRRVRLKQIGPRDRARYIGRKYGAYGRCGRPLCCATFLQDLDSVTMDTVRAQNLENKGAAKLSGVCGKLMNCLSFEVDMYRELRHELPEIGTLVRTPKGAGTVVSYDILSQMLIVRYGDETNESVHVKDVVKADS